MLNNRLIFSARCLSDNHGSEVFRRLFNWFRRIALPASMKKLRVDTIRLKLLKIAAKAVKSARYITFKLCSSCPYRKEFYETLDNINGLRIRLE